MAKDIFQENTLAPDFSLENKDGRIISKNDFKGKWIVLYFYPKDNTPGCSVEAMDFTRLKDDFNKLNAEIVGISMDSKESHAKFINDKELSIELLSDTELETIKVYKAWGIKKNYGKEYEGLIRSTVLINPQGEIAKHWKNVRAKGHAERVLKEFKKLLDNQ